MNTFQFRLAVVMERRQLSNPWQSVQWAAVEVVEYHGESAEPLLLLKDPLRERWLHSGFNLALYTDEAEGYFLNLTATQPFVFVMWRMEGERAVPHTVTASYNEASRMLDAGEQVDGLPMPPNIHEAAKAFVSSHYKPETKQRARAPSFAGARRDP
ncbi:MAG TPA: DUF3305 domain-containing protein [Burkholderiales bacterium]|jgi:hypothetical protein|nr:DUF3305 domain-containing protein [Burkholderiales bacterium]